MLDLHEQRTRQRETELRLDDPVQGPEAERAEANGIDVVDAGRTQHTGTALAEPHGCEHCDAMRFEPAQREFERTRRRQVEPLEVVDGEQHGRRGGELRQQRNDGGSNRARIDRGARVLRTQERRVERATLGIRQHSEGRGLDRREEIARVP